MKSNQIFFENNGRDKPCTQLSILFLQTMSSLLSSMFWPEPIDLMEVPPQFNSS